MRDKDLADKLQIAWEALIKINGWSKGTWMGGLQSNSYSHPNLKRIHELSRETLDVLELTREIIRLDEGPAR